MTENDAAEDAELQRDRIIGFDLFAGAGGFSEALSQAAEDLGLDLREAAINHWEPAIQTHEANHPDALQYHSKVEQLHPPNVLDELLEDEDPEDVSVDLLLAGPECTHFSNARGGKPVSEQKRMSPWSVLDWLEKLDVRTFIMENVKEIQDWGPVRDGQPTRNGEVFEAWVNALNKLGYAVDWTVLKAADYGDPTSRRRFFIVGSQDHQATFPEPTHSDEDPELPDYRTAADIIDWSDLGGSIWTRDLEDARKTPPKNSTMKRIAEGIRRHGDDVLEPYADVLEGLGRDEIRRLREERVVDYRQAGLVAEAVDDPFLAAVPQTVGSADSWLVKFKQNSPAQAADEPLDTIHANGNHYALGTAKTLLLRQQNGAHPVDVEERPVPTILGRGSHAFATVSQSLIMPKNGRYRGLHSNALYEPHQRPFHTVTTDPLAMLVSPSLIRWSHGGATLDFDDPFPTIATERGGVFSMASPVVRPFLDDCQGPAPSIEEPIGAVPGSDRYALVVPELWPWGLDVRYRMLQPRELKQAQGFPPDYDIQGTKTQRTKQIGNAVPVNLARNLVEHVLTLQEPSLASFGGGLSDTEDVEIPAYQDVVAADGGVEADD